MMNWFRFSFLSFLALTVAACGSDDGSPAPIATTQTGYLIGGLIESVPYQCGEHSGRTGRLGDFTFETGEPCDFHLGDLALRASAEALETRAVTPYDLTGSPMEAWTLMAIIDAISYRRPDTDLFLIVDGILTQRLPAVDLSQGDTAIDVALAPFKGTTKSVSVQSGREWLGRFVDENNNLIEDVDEMVEEGRGILANLRVGVPGALEDPILGHEANHNNRVNFRLYDWEGNPLTVFSVSYEAGDDDPDDWLWVTDGQNPDNSTPVAGLDQGDITGSNVFGIDLDVGRHKSTQVGTAYKTRAFSPGTFPSPITIFAHGVTNDEAENSHFAEELNFGYHIWLFVGTAGGEFNCSNLMLAQGSSSNALKTFLNVAKDLASTIFNGFDFVTSDGTDIEAGVNALKGFISFLDDAFNLEFENWWMLGLNAQSESYRVAAWGYPAVMMQCDSDGVTMAVLGYSDYDDHTFNLQVAFPGQKITVQK